jgi:HEAT repeat protein
VGALSASDLSRILGKSLFEQPNGQGDLRPLENLSSILGNSLSESHRDLLKALLADSEPRVRLQACRWILENRHLADFEVILGLFENDDDYGVRSLAAKILGGMGDARALEPLEKVFFDKELEWYANEFRSDWDLRHHRVPDDVLPLRISVALAVTSLDPQKGAPLLRPYLDHPDPRMSKAALRGMKNSLNRSSQVPLSEEADGQN